MKRIPVLSNTTDNKVLAWATIDDEDNDKVSPHRWGLTVDGHVVRKTTGGRRSLARTVLNISERENVVVIFVDDDPLNCQKDNLQTKKKRGN